MIRNATHEDGEPWRPMDVYDPVTGKTAKVPTLNVTTRYMDDHTGSLGVLKAGYLTSKGEWVVEHDGKLQKTGKKPEDTGAEDGKNNE